jgi:hypothetical protein
MADYGKACTMRAANRTFFLAEWVDIEYGTHDKRVWFAVDTIGKILSIPQSPPLIPPGGGRRKTRHAAVPAIHKPGRQYYFSFSYLSW